MRHPYADAEFMPPAPPNPIGFRDARLYDGLLRDRLETEPPLRTLIMLLLLLLLWFEM